MSLHDAPPATSRRRLDAHRRPPIDMEHLKRQTFGDAELERRVLALFSREALRLVEKLKTTEAIDQRREVAHAIVGSARNVGAFPMADLAAQIEQSHAPVAGRLKALEQSVARTRDFISRYLGEG